MSGFGKNPFEEVQLNNGSPKSNGEPAEVTTSLLSTSSTPSTSSTTLEQKYGLVGSEGEANASSDRTPFVALNFGPESNVPPNPFVASRPPTRNLPYLVSPMITPEFIASVDSRDKKPESPASGFLAGFHHQAASSAGQSKGQNVRPSTNPYRRGHGNKRGSISASRQSRGARRQLNQQIHQDQDISDLETFEYKRRQRTDHWVQEPYKYIILRPALTPEDHQYVTKKICINNFSKFVEAKGREFLLDTFGKEAIERDVAAQKAAASISPGKPIDGDDVFGIGLGKDSTPPKDGNLGEGGLYLLD
ncbi:hypothetical protein BS50DRAFT_628890 [Corynespora cassiicola Philippines]|uniref:Uncharacterized protein n=1 Tax=Corynespora cassiicola Philippines TaxID=1448308 RepID=A0A2T2P501_CORCC|nr:hypothetical protein BS50DRAFT_628890 [Corynespora cassiicola Philippines]